MQIKKWSVAALDKERAAQIVQETGCSQLLAILLQIRGFCTKDEIEELFAPPRNFADPFLLKDMDKAVECIQKAIDDFVSICVYGDYDADGVTATAMLYSYLESCGANVMSYIPQREQEGYGLNTEAIDCLHEQGVQLIVTVDNGISSVEEVKYAAQLGMQVVITDHHRPREILPHAQAVVNPHRMDCTYPFKELSGVGVAFKLIVALEGDSDMTVLLENYADLAAIGTIADVVPLTGENRALVKAGLPLLSHSDRAGVCALLEYAGMNGKELTASNVAFTLVPRINATGRIGSPDRAVHLLLSEDTDEAENLAQDICHDNDLRKNIECEMMEQALRQLYSQPQRLFQRVLVVQGQDWHHGVIGIVSSRITELFGKPSIVISYSGQEAKASGRSVEGFSLFDAICHCQELFTKFGGHPMAVGFSMPTEHIDRFCTRMNEFAAALPAEMPPYTVHLDCKLNPAALSLDMPKQIALLEPFGTENPLPVFGLYRMTLREIVPMGGGSHLKLRFAYENTTVQCLKFRTTLQEFPYQTGDVLDLAVTLSVNCYRQQEHLSVLIKDMRLSQLNGEELLADYRLYEKAMRQEPLTEQEAERLIPGREEFAAIYRFLKNNNGWQYHITRLWLCLAQPAVNFAKLLLALDVLNEQNLIALRKDGEIFRIEMQPATQKVDLSACPLLRQMQALRKDG